MVPNFNVINTHSGKLPNLNSAFKALGQISGILILPNFMTANISIYTVVLYSMCMSCIIAILSILYIYYAKINCIAIQWIMDMLHHLHMYYSCLEFFCVRKIIIAIIIIVQRLQLLQQSTIQV